MSEIYSNKTSFIPHIPYSIRDKDQYPTLLGTKIKYPTLLGTKYPTLLGTKYPTLLGTKYPIRDKDQIPYSIRDPTLLGTKINTIPHSIWGQRSRDTLTRRIV